MKAYRAPALHAIGYILALIYASACGKGNVKVIKSLEFFG